MSSLNPEHTSQFDEALRALLVRRSTGLSRRSFLSRLGLGLCAGVAGVLVAPLLPEDRRRGRPAFANSGACTDWSNCGICGRMCTQCGGASDNTQCPAGSTLSGCWSACCSGGKSGPQVINYCDCCGTGCSGGDFCANRCPQSYWGCSTSAYLCTTTRGTGTPC
jgi:hypothetical protein